MRRRQLLPVTALLLAAACNGSGSSTVLKQDFGAALRASVQKSDATSSKVDIDVKTEAAGQNVDLSGNGAFDGDVGSLTMSVGGTTIEERMTGGKLYLKVPNQPGWYVLSLTDLVGTSLANSASPSDSAKVLLAADNDVTKVGSEKVRGAETTHYKDTIKLDAQHVAKLGGIAKSSVEKLAASGLDAIPFDAWLDGKGRLVKLVEDVNVTVQGQTAHVVTTVERYDFGTKVTVAAPPLSEQKDGAPLLSALKGTTG
jgi:hypothetical protein